MDLKRFRQHIDRLDAEIVQMITRRMEYAVRTKRFKADVPDAGREGEILQKAKERSRALFEEQFAEDIFKLILAESRKLQSHDYQFAAFQGEHGAYSEVALKGYRHEWIGIPCAELSEIVENLETGAVDYGILPIENSVEGSVSDVQDILIESNLSITASITMPIRHCMMTLPGTDYREIKEVYSSPRALSQCHGFLKRHKLEARPAVDSAGAALMLLRKQPTAAAVIASSLSAKLYDLEILKENIQDHATNVTRYVLLSRGAPSLEGERGSIVFVIEHRAGALIEALKAFSDAGINMARLGSRPLRSDPQQVAFLLDFYGSASDPKVQEALREVQRHSRVYRFLGCYKEMILA